LKGRRGARRQGDKVSSEEAAIERSVSAQFLFRFTVFLLGLRLGNYSPTSGGLRFQSDLQSDTATTPPGFLPLISVPPETALEARRAECAAIREELAIRHTENAELIEKAKKKILLARVKAIRLRAEMAFLAAGGARGAFGREWLSAFLEEVCGPDTPTAVSDH
jgi:hypothetical protein